MVPKESMEEPIYLGITLTGIPRNILQDINPRKCLPDSSHDNRKTFKTMTSTRETVQRVREKEEREDVGRKVEDNKEVNNSNNRNNDIFTKNIIVIKINSKILSTYTITIIFQI